MSGADASAPETAAAAEAPAAPAAPSLACQKEFLQANVHMMENIHGALRDLIMREDPSAAFQLPTAVGINLDKCEPELVLRIYNFVRSHLEAK